MSSNYQKYQTRNPVKQRLLNNFLKRVTALVKKEGFESLIDLGCGEGMVIQFLRNSGANLEGKEVLGIDFSKEALSVAKSNNPNVRFAVGDVRKINQKDRSFDTALCLEVLEHLTNPEEALKEIARVANKRMILSVPDEPLFTILRFLSLQDVAKLGRHEEHVNFWNKPRFLEFLTENLPGWKVEVLQSTPWLVAYIERDGRPASSRKKRSSSK